MHAPLGLSNKWWWLSFRYGLSYALHISLDDMEEDLSGCELHVIWRGRDKARPKQLILFALERFLAVYESRQIELIKRLW